MPLSAQVRPLVNLVSMWIVAVVVLCVPLALGGNRPLVWPITLIVLSLTMVVNLTMVRLYREQPAVSLAKMKTETVAIAAFLIFCIIQIIPLGQELSSMLDRSADAVWSQLPKAATISLAPGESFLAILTWLNVFILGYLAMQFTRNEQRSVLFLTLLFWIVVFHAVLGFVLFHEFADSTLIGPKWAYFGSMTGAFVNRNTFGTFLASGAAIGLVLILQDLRDGGLTSTRRWLVGGALFKLLGLLLTLAVMVATGSRMGTAVGLLGLVLAAILVLSKGGIGKTSMLAVFTGTILTLAALALLVIGYGGLTVERLGSVETDTDVRWELYRQTWQLITERPWTGFGGGSYELAFPLIHGPGVSVDLLWQKAHNSYLGLWADYGLIFGTLPWLVLLIMVMRIIAVYRAKAGADSAAICAITVAVIASVHALVDFSLEIQGYALLFAAVIGTGAAGLSNPLPKRGNVA